jgi:hypothetical protein
MSKRETILQVRESLKADDALRIVNSIAGTVGASIERKIYYPYFWFSANCSTRTLFGKRPFSANCLVDGRNGLGATTDPFEVEESAVADRAIMATRTTTEMAEKSARRYLSHNLSRGLKMIGHFNIDLESRGPVYKSYWLVHCKGTLVMVDSTTGCLHTLGERAA